MPINNAVYEELGQSWWDDDAGFAQSSLRYCVNPVRHAYFTRQLRALGRTAGRVLDVGCGGGYLSEALARDGYVVTGLDPSAASLRAAREHARGTGLAVDYRVGEGEALPFADAAFDIVACCDVLEHVRDVAGVIAECARVLRPGGVFLFDTINRTWKSRLVMIDIAQRWPLTRYLPADVHVWAKFITPDELRGLLRGQGLADRNVVGLQPVVRNPWTLFRAIRTVARGPADHAAVARCFALRESSDIAMSYMGFAVREAGTTASPERPGAAITCRSGRGSVGPGVLETRGRASRGRLVSLPRRRTRRA